MSHESVEESRFRIGICAEAARIEEDATHASKSHYNDATAWRRYHNSLGAVAAVLAAAAGVTALRSDHPLLSALISFLAAAATAVLTFQKPGDHANQHRAAGAGYAEVRQRARQLRNVDVAGPLADDALRSTLVEIAALKARLDKESPGPSARAFDAARAGIEAGEARHLIDQKKE